MMSLIDSGPAVFSPILASALLPIISLTGILTIDVATFFLAIGALLLVRIPQPVKTAEGQAGKGGLLKEVAFGFKYIFQRPSLRLYLIVILALNVSSGFSQSITAPMILSRTNQNTAVFGAVETAAAVGGVLGGLIMSAWGGFKRRIDTMLGGWVINAVAGYILFGASRWPAAWMVTIAIGALTFPITNGAAQAIWQSKVAPDVQGRVFAARRFIAWLTDPIMPLVAGSLADFVTEPAMKTESPFSQAASWLVGSGPGTGMSLQFILSGILFLSVVIVGFLTPAYRNIERNLPDYDQAQETIDTSQGIEEEPHAAHL